MSRFSHEIDRLFEELVHEVWRGARRQPQQLPADSTLEFEIPTHGMGREDIVFTTDGQKVIVTVRRHANERVDVRDTEQFQQTCLLPAGSEVAAMEARFEGDVLRVRVTLRKRTFSRENP